jgi:uncharacterized RDD family membrane protein YckC
METKNIRIKRYASFTFDCIFILLLDYILYMLLGLFFKLDSASFQNYLIYHLLIIIVIYLFFGDIFFGETLGKYMMGIKVVSNEKHGRPPVMSYIKRGLLKIIFPVEGLIMLFSRSKKTLGDLWGKTMVVNKESNRFKLYVRLTGGILLLIVLQFCVVVSIGLAARNTDFYKVGADYLKSNNLAEISGLTRDVTQSRNTVNITVPVSDKNSNRYVKIFLKKNGDKWVVDRTEFIKDRILILGVGYTFDFSTANP